MNLFKAKGGRVNDVPPALGALIFVLSAILKLWYKTYRLDVLPEARASFVDPKNMIAVAWHSRVFLLPMLQRKFRKKLPMCGLISPSRDGAIAARFFECFGVKAIRGSTNSRAARAFAELIGAINEGCSFAITPDGPRGPVNKPKEGVLVIAKKTGVRLELLRMDANFYFTLPTWDRAIIPLPFSKITIRSTSLENYAHLERLAAERQLTPMQYLEEVLGE